MKNGAQLFPVGVDGVKSLLFGRLKHNDPGPGYLHFYPTVGPDYFAELTASVRCCVIGMASQNEFGSRKARAQTRR